jgi:hypothetical protein
MKRFLDSSVLVESCLRQSPYLFLHEARSHPFHVPCVLSQLKRRMEAVTLYGNPGRLAGGW